jgi:hypothetical protein
MAEAALNIQPMHFKSKEEPAMEHRCSERFATDLEVVVRRSGNTLGFGKIIDSSKLGFFIAIDTSQINLFQMLDVEILYSQEESAPYRHICSVCVTRKTDSGVGTEIESSRLEPTNVIQLRHPIKLDHRKHMRSDGQVPASNS